MSVQIIRFPMLISSCIISLGTFEKKKVLRFTFPFTSGYKMFYSHIIFYLFEGRQINPINREFWSQN